MGTVRHRELSGPDLSRSGCGVELAGLGVFLNHPKIKPARRGICKKPASHFGEEPPPNSLPCAFRTYVEIIQVRAELGTLIRENTRKPSQLSAYFRKDNEERLACHF